MGKRKGPHYTPEYKRQALDLADKIGLNRASRELGVSRGSLQTWKSKSATGESNPENKNITNDEENRRLRKENEELKKINHILKRAAAFFSQDHLK